MLPPFRPDLRLLGCQTWTAERYESAVDCSPVSPASVVESLPNLDRVLGLSMPVSTGEARKGGKRRCSAPDRARGRIEAWASLQAPPAAADSLIDDGIASADARAHLHWVCATVPCGDGYLALRKVEALARIQAVVKAGLAAPSEA